MPNSLRKQFEGWREKARTNAIIHPWERIRWETVMEAYDRVLASLDGCIVLKEADVLAEVELEARCYTPLGSGKRFQVDAYTTFEADDSQKELPVTVIFLRRESDGSEADS